MQIWGYGLQLSGIIRIIPVLRKYSGRRLIILVSGRYGKFLLGLDLNLFDIVTLLADHRLYWLQLFNTLSGVRGQTKIKNNQDQYPE